MAKRKWKATHHVLAETGEGIWIVHRGKELHRDYLGMTMKFNSRGNAEKVADFLNRREKK